MSPNFLLARFAGIAGLAAALLLLSCDLTGEKGEPAPGPPVDTLGVDTSDVDTSGAEARIPPHPPSEVLALAGDAQATVSWTPSEYAGTAAITGYRASAVEDSARQCAVHAALNACTISGLTNKTTYTFVVRAVSAHGRGDPSSPSLTVVPLPPRLPAPQGLAAVAGGGTATLSWTSPPPGTWVSVYSPQDLARTCGSDTASSCVVTGLEFGKTYTFVARAHSEVGAGATSDTTGPVKSLPTLPGPPLSASAVAGDTQATVSWVAPANNGGDSILGYEVSPLNSTGIGCSTGPQGRNCVVGKLPANVPVSFRVRAVNAFGSGSAKATTNVTPFFVQKVPGRPFISNATASNSQVTVTWTAPSAGASPITGYKVYVANTPERCTTTTLSCTVTGLANGTTYTFTVEAENALGVGARSFTVTATPSALPSEPGSVVATIGDREVKLAWSAPGTTGDLPLRYRAILTNPGPARSCTTSALNCTFTGLTNGTSYSFQVRAVNDSGEGPVSSTVSATPFALPGAPRNVSATAGDGRVTLLWDAPDSTGGGPILSYTAAAVHAPAMKCTVSPPLRGCNITGLSNGTSYTFHVAATNARGKSDSTLAPAIVPRVPPNAGGLWIPRNSGLTQAIRGVVWTDTQFVAVGDNGVVLTSPDGIAWTVRASGLAVKLYGVAWTGSRIIAVGENDIKTSTDGVNWTSRVFSDLRAVTMAGTRIAAVSSAGTVFTSLDAVNWQSSTLNGALYGVTWTGSKLVVVGVDGRIATSPDGVAWTQATAETGNLHGVTWTGEKIVAVGASGKLRYSFDGTVWMPGNFNTTTLNAAAWIDGRLYFVGNSGSIYREDPDGLKTLPTPAVSAALWAIASNGTRFVAVGDAGTILTSP